jgi:hypothetical protein
MAHLISFKTARFDVSKEKPNEINPIAGQSVLLWLRDALAKAHYQVTEPETEDWGWYIEVVGAEASYRVGASADATDVASPIEWIVQVHKHRSLKDRVLGRHRMTADDPLFGLIETLVRADDRLTDVDVAPAS